MSPHPKGASRSGDSSNQSGHNVSRPLKSLREGKKGWQSGGHAYGKTPHLGETGAISLQAFHPSACPHNPEGLEGKSRLRYFPWMGAITV